MNEQTAMPLKSERSAPSSEEYFGARVQPHARFNAMTVDVEDYFQVAAFEGSIDRSDWDRCECRVERNTQRLLALFEESRVSATFFVLGWVAERYPSLIRRIVESGHELASHGYDHVRVTQLDPERFRADVSKTRKILEDIGGCAVSGYRAPSYSIGRDNLWALDILADEGYRYSSSVYPVRHDLYGMPEAPRFAFQCPRNGLVEVPITTVSIFNRNIPCGGGGFFRLFPYSFSRWAMRRVLQADQSPCVFYLHPWEIDTDQPRQRQAPLKSRFRHYLNLSQTELRLRRLLADFEWGRMDQLFLGGGGVQ